MDNLIADVSDIDFMIETQLERQIGLGCLPFSNMNKSGAGVCKFFILNQCSLNNLCPLRHIKADRTVVCKHWLRGLCKKGDDCEFLHEYDMSKMPECYFFSKFGECMNKECPFLHIDPASKVQDCPWYDRGFCRNGPMCRNRHVRRVACKNYINGLCLLGKSCKYAHPIWWPLPGSDQDSQRNRWICHYCNERGHKIQFCLKLPPEERLRLQEQQRAQNLANAATGAIVLSGQSGAIGGGLLGNRFQSERLKYGGLMNFTQTASSGPRQGPQKPLDEVTCFKCGEKGHYANRCNKGYLAFLSKVSLQPHETDVNRA
ncbi:hypothetical protein P879_08612 [Paragonimus westermani]|uniref:Cleavage and polyadenylation specificity factor subunit 4 n=1 Tax=Paragonimus westermani TaxID=34504 RepID=A0A8T0DDB4_9TREM|nr:hypothetical protein P879_08612 [Paragonimus westermani]